MIPSQRQLFDVPEDIAYFNCAYNSPMTTKSIDALVEGARSRSQPWSRLSDDFFSDAEEFRRAASRALGGSSENYALVPAASYGVSTAAKVLSSTVSASSEILVIEEAFPSNFYPWQRLAEAKSAKLNVVATPENHDWTSAILDRISGSTRVVAVPNCHWTDGAIVDLVAISDATRSVGAALVVDASQSLGVMPLDFDRVKPDFCVAAGYKWMLLPYGLSVLYADPRWHESEPLEESWLARQGAEDFAALVDYTDAYEPGARRFDVGQKCTPTLVPGGIVALEQIATWGVSSISATLKATTDLIVDSLEDLPLEPLPGGVRSPHILGLRSVTPLESNMVSLLAEMNVYLSRRGEVLRIAPYLHNSDGDVQRLRDALAANLSQR